MASRWSLAAIAAVVLVAGGGRAAPAAPPAPVAPASSRFAGFVDQTGVRFDPARLAGKPVLMNFIFAGCGTTCPMQTAELSATLKALPPALRRDVRVVSVTVDPQNDTPAALRRFGETFGARAPNWIFLTGNRPAMLRLVATYSGAGAANGQFAETMHSTDILLLTGRGRVIRRYRALPLDRNRLRQDLEMLTEYPALRR